MPPLAEAVHVLPPEVVIDDGPSIEALSPAAVLTVTVTDCDTDPERSSANTFKVAFPAETGAIVSVEPEILSVAILVKANEAL